MWRGAVVLAALVGCGSSDQAPAIDAARAMMADARQCQTPTGPSSLGCDAFICAGDLQSDWVTSQAATGRCTTSVPSLTGELYAGCDWTGITPSACTGIAVGQQLCSSTSGWTELCDVDGDCPPARTATTATVASSRLAARAWAIVRRPAPPPGTPSAAGATSPAT
jgi:hypothetical protein